MEESPPENNNKEVDLTAQKVLDDAEVDLGNIKNIMFDINEQEVFYSLMLFVSYYTFIIEFYKKNIYKIVSVRELLLVKYIDMIKNILIEFKESNYSNNNANEILSTIDTINNRLFRTVGEIKNQANTNLEVDLKTISDLVKMDF